MKMCENNLSYNTSFGMARQIWSLVKKIKCFTYDTILIVCHTSIENALVEQDLQL